MRIYHVLDNTVELKQETVLDYLYLSKGDVAMLSGTPMEGIGNRLSDATQASLSRLQSLAMRHLSTGESKDKPGVFARTWPIGSTALWIAVLLTGYVLVYYF